RCAHGTPPGRGRAARSRHQALLPAELDGRVHLERPRAVARAGPDHENAGGRVRRRSRARTDGAGPRTRAPARPGTRHVTPLSAQVIGAISALAVPLRLRGSGIARLIRGVPPLGRERGNPTAALRAAHALLRILARTRLPWWRNTCLYRAVAECLVLRYYGIPSRVRLGV